MKFKKDGKMFEDIYSAGDAFCRKIQGPSPCEKCPLKKAAGEEDCDVWQVEHLAEAARLMGYEVVDEEHTCRTCCGCEIEDPTIKDCPQWAKRPPRQEEEASMDNQNTTAPCKWCDDETCVNSECPMYTDFCPVPGVPGVCKYEKRENPMLKNISKIYLAGKISGDPDYRSKFERAEQDYISKGKIVLNPAKLPEGMGNDDYMRICFAMLESADAVFFLQDWKQSAGAMLEYRWCLYTGKTIMNLVD